MNCSYNILAFNYTPPNHKICLDENKVTLTKLMILALSIIAKRTDAEPRAVAMVSSSGTAFPSEKLPRMTEKKTVMTSPAASSQDTIKVEPYL